jgi:K+-transporting ATPase KdpF subunit
LTPLVLRDRMFEPRTVCGWRCVVVADGRLGGARNRRCLLDPDLRFPLGVGACLMSAADAFGLVVAIAVLVYLVYALVRGERF